MTVSTPRSRWAARATAFAMAGVIVGGVSACADEDHALRTPDGKIISTSTTRVAQVNIVNPERDFSKTCLAPTVPDQGESDVARVVVTDPALLDAMCALGLGSHVTAVAAEPGSVPAYLGPELTAVPAIGTYPSAAQVSEAKPALILSTPDTESTAAAVHDTGAAGSARTVNVTTGADWRTTFTQVAAALNRNDAARQRLDEFDAEAKRTGTVLDAPHNQVSLVRFTKSAEMLEGTGNFAAGILSAIGVQRPAAQRGPDAVKVTDANFKDADADLIYISYDSPSGLDRAKSVMDGDEWQDMGAPTWKRVLWVDDAVWYRASGLAAAWLVLNDVKSSLNGSSAGE
ncbi:MAG: ABC transporter substrate-binding protein [Gordonia sp. (in: high G+C Gram-positive bacteria)]